MKIYFGPYIEISNSVLQNEIYACPEIYCNEQKTQLIPGHCCSCKAELICLEIERECLDDLLKENQASDFIEKVSENIWIFPKEFKSEDEKSVPLENPIDPFASLHIAKKKYKRVLTVFDEVFNINTQDYMKLGFVTFQKPTEPVKEEVKPKCAVCEAPTDNCIPSPFNPLFYYRCENCFNDHRIALPEMIMVLKNGVTAARNFYGENYLDKYLYPTKEFFKISFNEIEKLSLTLEPDDCIRLLCGRLQ